MDPDPECFARFAALLTADRERRITALPERWRITYTALAQGETYARIGARWGVSVETARRYYRMAQWRLSAAGQPEALYAALAQAEKQETASAGIWKGSGPTGRTGAVCGASRPTGDGPRKGGCCRKRRGSRMT